MPTFPQTRLALRRARFDLWSRHIAATRRPVLVGPWTSEVGFEALYWIPFVAAWRHRYGIDKTRIVAVGRGGSGVWYDAAAVADVYEHAPVKDVRTYAWSRAKQTGSVKQFALTAWDRHLCGLAASSLGIPRYHIFHPSWMYQLLTPWWTDARTLVYLQSYTRHSRIALPPLPPGMNLPPQFCAAKFYARPTFPPQEDLILFAQQLLARVGQRMPVVLLHAGGHYDDHADLIKADGKTIYSLPPLPPAENLAIQSAVLGRAQAFLGTYGGMSQLALMMGVPSCAFYSDWHSTALAHLTLSQVLSVASRVPFHVGTPGEAGLIERLFGANQATVGTPAGVAAEQVLP